MSFCYVEKKLGLSHFASAPTQNTHAPPTETHAALPQKLNTHTHPSTRSQSPNAHIHIHNKRSELKPRAYNPLEYERQHRRLLQEDERLQRSASRNPGGVARYPCTLILFMFYFNMFRFFFCHFFILLPLLPSFPIHLFLFFVSSFPPSPPLMCSSSPHLFPNQQIG